MSVHEPAIAPHRRQAPASTGLRIAAPILVTIGALLLGTVAAVALDGLTTIGDEALNALLGFAVSALILCGGLLLWASLPAHERRAALALKHSRGGAIGLGLTVGIGAMILTVSIFLGATLIDSSIEDKLEERQDSITGSAWQIVLTVIAIAVLAPVGEELVFRGLLLRAVARRLAFVPAAIVTALVFAALHLDQYAPFLWPRTIGLLCAGVILALIYHWRGYPAAVIAHFTVNAVAVIGLLASS